MFSKLSLAILCLISGVISIPTFNSDGGYSYELEGVAAGNGQCEVCIDYYITSGGTTNGYFRSAYDYVIELNSTKGECCAGGSCASGGCNQHVISEFPTFFSFNYTNTTAYYNGNISGGGAQISSCTPPGTSQLICANFVFTYQLINTAQNYMVGNQSFALNQDSLLVTITSNNWQFDPASWGMRLKLLVQDRLATVANFVLQPGNVATPFVEYDNFNSAEMDPDNTAQGTGGVKLCSYALVDGVAAAANISGFWAHPYDNNARYIYIDVPKFNSYMSYSFNLYFASGSSASTSTNNLFPPLSSNTPGWVSEYLTYIIAIAAVFGLCAVFGCMSLIYCKCCRRRRRD